MKWRLVTLACISAAAVIQFFRISFIVYTAFGNKIKTPRQQKAASLLLHSESYEIPMYDSELRINTRDIGFNIVKVTAKYGKFGVDNIGLSSTGKTATEQHNLTEHIDIDTGSPLNKVGTVYPTLDDCLRIIQDGQNGRNITDVAAPDVTEDEEVVRILQQGCDDFMKRYDFMSKDEQIRYSTPEELDFTIAYTILVHKNLHQIATLLSAIYRNQNIYCIHADLKSPDPFLKGIRMIAKCFDNVFEATKRERVVYASFSKLKAEVNCMKDLLTVPVGMYGWKYLVNLCGQDFPVSTNLEIVNQLKSKNGKSSFSVTRHLNDIAVRSVKYVHELQNVSVGNQTMEMIYKTKRLLEPPPYNLTIVQNMPYALFTREFLQWALFDSKEGAALFNWSSYTNAPDEHFWGYWQHNACVFGGGSMWWLMKAEQLFVNKLDISYDATPITCLRKLLDERTRGNTSDLNPHKNPTTL